MTDADAVVASGFRAVHLSTPIHSAVIVARSDSAPTAHALLTMHRVDQAPVVDGDRVFGWVETIRLADPHIATVKQAFRPLADTAIISESSALDDLIELVAERNFVFLAGARRVSAFVCPSDLDRHAAKCHFYQLVSIVEMLLGDIIGMAYPAEVLAGTIAGETRSFWLHAVAKNSDTNPVEYLYLQTLTELFAALAEPDWTKDLHDGLVRIAQCRKDIMHPVRPLLNGGSPQQWARVAQDAKAVTAALSVIRHRREVQ